MSLLRLALAPLALGLLLLAAVTLLPDPASRAAAMVRAVHAGKLLAALGAAAAAHAFERGDYLRRAWALQALYMVLILRDLLLGALPPGATVLGLTPGTWNHAIVVVANVAGVAATWMMAQAWQVAGLDAPGARSRRALLTAAGALIALAITGAPLLRDLRALLGGSVTPVAGVASTLADAASIALLAPVLLTVIAMRGGQLAWPWGMFAASMLCWLLYDASYMATRHLRPTSTGAWPILGVDLARFLACLYAAAAGLGQRLVITSQRDAGEPP